MAMSTVSPTLDVIFGISLSLKFKLNFSFELIDTVTSSWMWGACLGEDPPPLTTTVDGIAFATEYGGVTENSWMASAEPVPFVPRTYSRVPSSLNPIPCGSVSHGFTSKYPTYA